MCKPSEDYTHGKTAILTYIQTTSLPSIPCNVLFSQKKFIMQLITSGGSGSYTLDLLLARLMGQYCFAHWRLLASSVVVCNWSACRRARGRAGGRHCMAGQYGYVPLRRHLVYIVTSRLTNYIDIFTYTLQWLHKHRYIHVHTYTHAYSAV